MSQVQCADFQVFQGVSVVGAAETLIGASVPAVVESPTCKCSVKVLLVYQPATGTNGVLIKIYRGKDLTGVLVGGTVTQNAGITVGNPQTFSSVASDSLTNAGQAQYCFSITALGSSATGTVNQAAIETMVLSG